MNEAPEADYILQPERFIGEIAIGNQRVAVSLTASAGASGQLALDVEPISVSGSSGGALELMRSIGEPGHTTDEFGLDCKSSSGKRLTSDRAYLAGYNHNSEGLHIQLRAAEASLGMTGRETHDRPALCFSLVGFECFPPAHAIAELGSVLARGATRTAATNEITGTIAVQASDKNVSTDWRQQAERLLKHLRLVLGFARGSPLHVPITEFYEGDHVDVTFYEVGGTLALFVRYYLTITPPLPEAEQDAARPLGKERFEFFVAQLGRRLAGGRNMIRDVLEEISAEESDFFTQEEIDALRAVKEAASPEKDKANGGGHG